MSTDTWSRSVHNHVTLRFLTDPYLVHRASTSAACPAPGNEMTKSQHQPKPASTLAVGSHRLSSRVSRILPDVPSTFNGLAGQGLTAPHPLLNGRVAPDVLLHGSTDLFVCLVFVSASHVMPANMIHLCPMLRSAYHPSQLIHRTSGSTHVSGIHMIRA
jgi:hypothetical protein